VHHFSLFRQNDFAKCSLICNETKTPHIFVSLLVNKGPIINLYRSLVKNLYFTWLFFPGV